MADDKNCVYIHVPEDGSRRATVLLPNGGGFYVLNAGQSLRLEPGVVARRSFDPAFPSTAPEGGDDA